MNAMDARRDLKASSFSSGTRAKTNSIPAVHFIGQLETASGFRNMGIDNPGRAGTFLRIMAVKITARLLLYSWLAGLAPVVVAQQVTPVFEDRSTLLNEHFRHKSPPTELRHTHLTMGSGVAAIDMDHDGWPDLWLGQGCVWNGSFRSSVKTHDTLLRNERGTFRNVSELSGLATEWFTTGVASGDIDNDGFDDLFVTSLGRNHLYLNNGDGTFRAAEAVEPNIEAWHASCTLVDVNNDSVLDVFVTRYVKVSAKEYKTCVDAATGLGIVCPPREFEFHHDLLLQGQGDGTFRDISTEAGIDSVEAAPGLGVVVIDANDDGAADLYVANDSTPNHLWVNNGSGSFSEEALISGTAVNGQGLREAGMGTAAGDVTGEGWPDLIVTNYYDESNTLYRNEGGGFFLDVSGEIGIGPPSRSRLAFGVNFVDLDGDSDLDLFVANGHIHDRLAELGRNIPYAQSPQVFANDGNKRLDDCSSRAGEMFQKTYVGRGSVVMDYDRDDRSDLVMTNLNDSPTLFRNSTIEHGRLVRLRLNGVRSSRHPISARVEAHVSEPSKAVVRFLNGSDSYLSCSENVVLVGVDSDSRPDSLTIRWPSGLQQTVTTGEAGNEWAIIEGRDEVYQLPQ